MTAPVVVGLRCEHLVDPLGLGVPRPRLSWRTETEAHDWRQAAYQVEVRAARGSVLWDSGRVQSHEAVLVQYGGAPLRSRQDCRWRIRVWGEDGSGSEWSDPASFEMGLLEPGDWFARFITPDWDEDTSASQPCPYFRCEFQLSGEVAAARLYVTALGVYEAEINGGRVGDHVLSPGWTSYGHRLRYQTHDVTPLLQRGTNVIGAVLADGWARGNLGFITRRNRYTDRLALLAQLEIALTDGTEMRVVTDESWRAATGPILVADLYDGETYDARLEPTGWSQPTFDDRSWSGVRLLDRDCSTLVAPSGPPVRLSEELTPVAITRSLSGKTIVDFGQNLVGRIRLRTSGPAGTRITLRHAEVLDGGEIFTRALRSARATNQYTLRGAGIEEYEPRFTFHGFRFLEVSGWPGELESDSLTAVVCHSDMTRTGWFECSDPDINRLHENIVWSLRGNFLDIPTDCPQRSERLGWTGDIQVFAPTACLLYDVAGFLSSWLVDLAADQKADGSVPAVVPDILSEDLPVTSSTAGWADAAVIVPWTLYQHFGDRGLLEAQYPSMRAWIEHVRELAGPDLIWANGFQFGDWLDPAAPPDRPGFARADHYLVATAFFARSTGLLSETAAILGKKADAGKYARLSKGIRAAFQRRFAADGLRSSTAQTELVLALAFRLLPVEREASAVARLAELIDSEGFRLGTGFLGTPDLCAVLTQHGRLDVAYKLLLQRDCPSWLYPVTMGATTVWERWDAIQTDGSIHPGDMLSFNHYAFGAIGAWLYGTVAGISLDPRHPGWQRFRVHPRPGGGLTSARARLMTPYGLVQSAWRLEAGRFFLSLEVPPNTIAQVWMPDSSGPPFEVGSGQHEFDSRPLLT